MSRDLTSPDRLKAVERRIRALELRKAGWGYREIGKELGCSTSTAHKMVKRELDRLLEKRTETADQLRTMELTRLDSILKPFYQSAVLGDKDAAEMVLKIMRERRAYVVGLQQPTRIQGVFGFGSLTDEEVFQRGMAIGLVEVKSLEDRTGDSEGVASELGPGEGDRVAHLAERGV